MPFYAGASLVVNLTDRRQAIETFGLTPLEAMAAGLPVIVPTVGGPAEMVSDGREGYLRDVADLAAVAAAIDLALADAQRYCALAEAALSRSRLYSQRAMDEGIESVVADTGRVLGQ